MVVLDAAAVRPLLADSGHCSGWMMLKGVEEHEHHAGARHSGR